MPWSFAQPQALIIVYFRCSCFQFGTLGLLERENAAILNESLKDMAAQTINAFGEALYQLKLCSSKQDFYLTQNDGTLIRWSLTIHHFVCIMFRTSRLCCTVVGARYYVLLSGGPARVSSCSLFSNKPSRISILQQVSNWFIYVLSHTTTPLLGTFRL